MAELVKSALEITVTVDGLPGLDTVLYEGAGRHDDDDGWMPGREVTLGDEIVAQATAAVLKDGGAKKLVARVAEITNEEIRTAVRDLIAAQLAKGFRKTNTYGEPVGETTTLTEVLADEFRRALVPSGKGYDRKAGLLEELLRKEIGSAFDKELKTVVDAAKEEARTLVRQRAAEFIASAALSMKGV